MMSSLSLDYDGVRIDTPKNDKTTTRDFDNETKLFCGFVLDCALLRLSLCVSYKIPKQELCTVLAIVGKPPRLC